MIRKLLYIIVFSCISILSFAQESLRIVDPIKDTLSYEELSSKLENVVSCSDSLKKAMNIYVEKNPQRKINGYRVRIFFDNKQEARLVSSQIVEEFTLVYPNVGIYRSYENPYFKVTVGDFRSKSEALKFLNEIKTTYPTAFIVRERL